MTAGKSQQRHRPRRPSEQRRQSRGAQRTEELTIAHVSVPAMRFTAIVARIRRVRGKNLPVTVIGINAGLTGNEARGLGTTR